MTTASPPSGPPSSPPSPSARREDAVRLVGSGASNRVMGSELLRLVKRSSFDVRLSEPRRDGPAALVYPFDPAVLWVAACHHRTSSRVLWDLASSPAVRLEPFHADLVQILAADDRLDGPGDLTFSVEVGPVDDFAAHALQVRGAARSAVEDAARRRGRTARVETEGSHLRLNVRRTGEGDARRTLLSIDAGGGPRHLRGARVAVVDGPLRETLAAQVVLASRWDARDEILVDPLAGGATIPIEAAGLATGAAVRQPADLPALSLPALAGLPTDAPALYPGTIPRILASDSSQQRVLAMIGNLRAAGLTGPAHEGWIVVRRYDARELNPDTVRAALPGAAAELRGGVFCFNPPYGRRVQVAGGEQGLLDLYRDLGRALGRFRGWRAACFVANPRFVEAFGHRPASSRPSSNGGLPGAIHVFEL